MKGQENTIVGEFVKEPADNLTDGQVAQIALEVANPEETIDKITIGGKTVQIRFLTWKYERRMLNIIAPYCRVLIDGASVGAFEEVLSSLLAEAETDLTRLAIIILSAQAETIGIDLGEFRDKESKEKALAVAIESWIDENARFEEICELVKRQIVKNKLADSLGKLWAPGVLAIKTLKIIDSLPLHLKSLLESNSIQSVSGTASNTPKK